MDLKYRLLSKKRFLGKDWTVKGFMFSCGFSFFVYAHILAIVLYMFGYKL